MRDKVKDSAYFEKYIQKRSASILKFEGLLEQVIIQKGETFEGVKSGYGTLEMFYLDKIKASYSSNSDVAEIKKVYPRFLECAIKSWTINSGYEILLNVVSLAVLLNIDKSQFEEAIKFFDKKNISDIIIDFLIHKIDSEWVIHNNEVLYPLRYELLGEIIKLDDKIKQQNLLKRYLADWYHKHSDAAWYNSHKSNQNTYNGYLCFEAGAIAKILGIDDEELKDNQYYPYDMVHFKG